MNYQANTKDTHGTEPRRAVCYLRVANAADHDSFGAIDTQREACEGKAQELRATVVHVYEDMGTGSSTANRPALRAMVARVMSEPHIDYVITWDHDRLARNLTVYREILRTLKTAGTELVTVKEPGAHFHQFMQTLTAAMAELATQNRRETRRARKVASQ